MTKRQNSKRVYVSFWHMRLANLPLGSFTHRILSAKQAKQLILSAQREERLLCVSEDDLLAPYHEDQQRDHGKFRKVLKDHFGLDLAFEDFCSQHKDENETCYSVNPLATVFLAKGDQLVVVTCHYTLAGSKRTTRRNLFQIAPDSVEFHLIKMA